MMDIDVLIDHPLENPRLDHVVSRAAGEYSRSRAAQLILQGRILVSGTVRKPSYKVKPGDHITGTIDTPVAESPVVPEKLDLDILFEDDYLMVVNKPAGLVVHPGAGNESGTLVNALLFHSPGIINAGDDTQRSGIVHRLDKDTSGAIVVAKTGHAFSFLQKEFKYRRVDKRYLALVNGTMPEDEGRIDLPIGRHPVKRKLMSVKSDSGKPALTLWEVKERFGTATLVEATIKTGRTHQIRVHLYSQGYPIIGDPVYQPKRFRIKSS